MFRSYKKEVLFNGRIYKFIYTILLMDKKKIKIKLLNKDAKIPFYATEGSAGFDLYSIQEYILEPGRLSMINTGVAIEIPEGYCVQFWDRSGLGAKGIHHFAGLIDSDYRGELKILLFNSTGEKYKIEKGDRIIQAIIVPIVQAEFEIVQELSETKRGEGGFHSTGKK